MRTPLALLLLPLLAAADWPPVGRTTDRNPVSPEKNAPTDWAFPTADTKPRNITWSVGTGFSRSLGGPVVSDGLVWIATYDRTEDGFLSVLACYREADGQLLYKHGTPTRSEHLKRWAMLGWGGAPVVEGDRLYFCTSRREVVCFDIAPLKKGTGGPRELWALDMIAELKVSEKARMYPCESTLGSMASHGKHLYVPAGNFYDPGNPPPPTLLCVRKDTGKIVWQDPPTEEWTNGHYASPLVVEVGGRPQVIHSQRDGWVRSFDAETGKLIWTFDLNTKAARWDDRGREAWDYPRYAVAPPVYASGRVYLAIGQAELQCGDDAGRIFCLDPTKTGDVSRELDDGPRKGKPNPNSALVWAFADETEKGRSRLHNVRGPVAVAGGYVVAADFFGNVHCLDEQTGKRHWSYATGEGFDGGPLVVDGKIYLATTHGGGWVLELAKAKKLLTRVEADEAFASPPVFANGTLYLLSEATLYAVRKP